LLHQFSDLILLHGMEDTHKNLSQTTTLVVSGPIFFSKRIDGQAWFTTCNENWNLIILLAKIKK
jgi:hypothetical protein